jgi:hypothetical protein
VAEVIATPVTELHAPEFRGRRMQIGWSIIALIGFVLLAIGLVVDPRRTWISYLMAFTFAFTTCAGGLILLMISYAANARWMSVVRRTMEAVTLPLPVLALLFVPVLFGLSSLYPWHTPAPDLPHHELAIYEHREAYLNPTAFTIRAVVYFVVLITAATVLRRWSLLRDRNGAASETDPLEALRRERRFASGMLPFVGFAFSFAVIDWVMPLNGVWYSSMFPVNLFAGGFLAAIATVTVLTERVWVHHATSVITQNHFHALGRLLFAFVVFWTYTSYFQAMLIRIANKPEEVTFYLERTDGAWRAFVWILIIGHFALPFLFLLPRSIKFRPRAMAIAAGWLLAMHVFDVYWQVIPAQVQGEQVLHWLDLGALAAVVGTSLAVAAWRQHRVPIVAERDPFLSDGAVYRSPL